MILVLMGCEHCKKLLCWLCGICKAMDEAMQANVLIRSAAAWLDSPAQQQLQIPGGGANESLELQNDWLE